MPRERQALLLIGSPRKPSNSEALGNGLCGRLQKLGWGVDKARALDVLRSPAQMEEMLGKVGTTDLLILSSPLYADGVPAMVLSVFREIRRARGSGPPSAPVSKPRLAAVFNCGFPEARQNDVALKICRLFAGDAGFDWAGGLAMGMGGMLNQRPLEEGGGKVKPILRALSLAAEALDQGRCIPRKAVHLMARPVIPRWLYVLGGNWGWRWQANKNEVPIKDLFSQPFAL